MPNTDTLASFIESQVAELQPRLRRLGELEWLVATTGKPEHEAELSQAIQDLRLLLADPKRFQSMSDLMNGATASNANANADPILSRQAALLWNQFRGHRTSPQLITQITEREVAIQSAFVNVRAVVNGRQMTDNEIKDILRESDDVALRQSAWEANKHIGAQVADTVRELARLRNDAAREAGFDNYYAMRLELDELEEAELFALFDQLKTGLDPAWRDYKGNLDAQLAQRFGVRPGDLRPWHYADPFFQESQPSDVHLDPWFADKDPRELTRAYFRTIGMDIDDILARSDLYERAGKDQHAFCTDVDRAGDIRVLCNLRPSAYWTSVMLHEFGHATYDKYVDASLPFLLRTHAHTLTTEAIAILEENLINESAWLARYAGVPKDEAAALSTELNEAARTKALIFARWVFVMCHFERALYRDPEQDLNALWWDVVEQFQWVRRPDERALPDWAAKMHTGVAPVYYHNYLLGAMMSAQLRDHLLQHVAAGDTSAYVSDARVGDYLIERVFKPGALRDWRGWLRHATGQDLSVASYVKRLS